jgi:ketosteroid isomerase-like protein
MHERRSHKPSERSTTFDLLERIRVVLATTNVRELDTAMSFFAPEATWKLVGLGELVQGAPAIRVFLEEWMGAYEELSIEVEEVLELGNGHAFAVLLQTGRPVGSAAHVRYRVAQISTWVAGVVVQITGYNDIDEARAVAERLAEEAG